MLNKRGGNSKKLSKNSRTEAQKRKKLMQPAKTERNRQRKREKHLRVHPNDLQLAKQMKSR